MAREDLRERIRGFHPFDAWATITLLVVSVVLSIMRFQGADLRLLTLNGSSWPAQPWALFTSCLLHGDGLHLLMNTLWLVQLGIVIEALYGTRATAFLYVLCGSASMAAEWLMSSNAIGLSGIVYGQLGLLWALTRWHPGARGLLDQRIARWMIGWFFLCIVFTHTGVLLIANWAHGVGALLGALAGWTLSIERDRRGWRWFAFPAACFALVLATFVVTPRGALIGRAQELSDRGGAAYVDRDLAQSEQFYRASLALHETAIARWNLHITLRDMGQHTESDVERLRALELDPDIQKRNTRP